MSYQEYFAISKAIRHKIGTELDREEVISFYTNGLKNSLKELTKKEYKGLLQELRLTYDLNRDYSLEKQKLRRIIFSIGREIGMLYGTTKADHKMNAAKLQTFLRERGVVKKSLNSMSVKELQMIIRQFRSMRDKKKTIIRN